jgi:hypothetical protein
MQDAPTARLLASDFQDVALPALPDLPGMISDPECRYLYWLSSRLEGLGCAVEVGSWLGRSSLHIAAGLAARGGDTALHCFDGFAWAPNDVGKSSLPLRPGDDFQSYFLENVAPYRDRITAHKTKIARIAWQGSPIELLFLDAPKKLPDILHCLKVFGPALLPGTSHVAIQDYLYFPAYPLAVCMDGLRESLELVHVVLDGSTVAFRLTRPLDPARIDALGAGFYRLTPADVHAVWDRILAPLPPKARERLEPGRALHLYDCGAKQAAAEVMKELPMTPFQQDKIAQLATSHHYLGYPELFTAAGYPGTAKQNLLSHAKRLRDWARGLSAGG